MKNIAPIKIADTLKEVGEFKFELPSQPELPALQFADKFATLQSQIFPAKKTADAFKVAQLSSISLTEQLAQAAKSVVKTPTSVTEQLTNAARSMQLASVSITEQLAKATHLRASEVLMPFEQFQNAIKALFPPYVSFIDSLTEAAQKFRLVDPFANIQARLAVVPAFDLSKVIANLPVLLSNLQNFTAKEEAAAFNLLAKRGLAGMEEFLTPREVAYILKLNRTKGVKAVDSYIFRLFKKNKFRALNRMVRAWWRVNYLEKRKRTVLKAIRAHREKDYELAIPALLPLIDGLAAEIARPVNTIRKRKFIYTKEAAALYRTQEPEVWSACFEQIVCSMVYKDYDPRSGKPPQSSVNRHGILHGSVINYGSELNSYRIVFLLNVMAKIAPQRFQAN